MLRKEVQFQANLQGFEDEWNSAQWSDGVLKDKLLEGQTIVHNLTWQSGSKSALIRKSKA